MPRPHRLVLPSVLLALVIALAGCGVIPVVEPRAAAPSAEPTASVEPSPTPSIGSDDTDDGETAGGDTDYAAAFAEREQFIRDQQLPLDGSLLTAVTPAQKEFIAQQRAYIESRGAQWTAQDESIALALAADACETAILNGHKVDTTVLSTHVATSPLIATLIPDEADETARASAEKNIASVMVFGTTFLCPADGEMWKTAYTEAYGG